jgi:peptidoglycan/xylan/chitin deacetylase (PgdA/CDA1 family)
MAGTNGVPPFHSLHEQGSSIANHTYSHSNLRRLTAAKISAQIARGPRSSCVRPPYGATNPTVRHILTQQRLRQVLWTIDTRDWSRPGTARIVKAATGPTVQKGSIVLLQDGGGNRSQTVAALPQIIAALQHRGYVIRRIPGTLTRRRERIAGIPGLSIDTIELYERNIIDELALRLVHGELPVGS